MDWKAPHRGIPDAVRGRATQKDAVYGPVGGETGAKDTAQTRLLVFWGRGGGAKPHRPKGQRGTRPCLTCPAKPFIMCIVSFLLYMLYIL